MKIPFQVDLKDKVIVITGGAGILGSYWAEAFAECGAKVAILDRSLEAARKKAEQLSSQGKMVLGIEADVLNKDSLKKAHELILKQYGPCDILVNGAGGNNPKGTTSKEYLYEEDLISENKDMVTFF
jgi:NAD(P)-dependent dehydrogenase (short-subunit alcohol dehydrogenase family)